MGHLVSKFGFKWVILCRYITAPGKRAAELRTVGLCTLNQVDP
jgi:hypothetical protein